MRLHILLLLVVFWTHYGTTHFAQLYQDQAAASRALFYIAQGLKGCILWLAVALLSPRRVSYIPIWAVCAWGFFEDAQVSACRAARGVESPPVLGLWQGVCGGSWYGYSLLVGLVAASVAAYGVKRER